MKDLLVLLAHLLTTIAKLSRPGAFTGIVFITFNEYAVSTQLPKYQLSEKLPITSDSCSDFLCNSLK
jgi:hypothetical protein